MSPASFCGDEAFTHSPAKKIGALCEKNVPRIYVTIEEEEAVDDDDMVPGPVWMRTAHD